MEYNNALCVLLAFGIQVGCDILADFYQSLTYNPCDCFRDICGVWRGFCCCFLFSLWADSAQHNLSLPGHCTKTLFYILNEQEAQI